VPPVGVPPVGVPPSCVPPASVSSSMLSGGTDGIPYRAAPVPRGPVMAETRRAEGDLGGEEDGPASFDTRRAAADGDCGPRRGEGLGEAGACSCVARRVEVVGATAASVVPPGCACDARRAPESGGSCEVRLMLVPQGRDGSDAAVLLVLVLVLSSVLATVEVDAPPAPRHFSSALLPPLLLPLLLRVLSRGGSTRTANGHALSACRPPARARCPLALARWATLRGNGAEGTAALNSTCR